MQQSRRKLWGLRGGDKRTQDKDKAQKSETHMLGNFDKDPLIKMCQLNYAAYAEAPWKQPMGGSLNSNSKCLDLEVSVPTEVHVSLAVRQGDQVKLVHASTLEVRSSTPCTADVLSKQYRAAPRAVSCNAQSRLYMHYWHQLTLN
eukprot:17694-Heterococcus_DN1.PRE.1